MFPGEGFGLVGQRLVARREGARGSGIVETSETRWSGELTVAVDFDGGVGAYRRKCAGYGLRGNPAQIQRCMDWSEGRELTDDRATSFTTFSKDWLIALILLSNTCPLAVSARRT